MHGKDKAEKNSMYANREKELKIKIKINLGHKKCWQKFLFKNCVK